MSSPLSPLYSTPLNILVYCTVTQGCFKGTTTPTGARGGLLQKHVTKHLQLTFFSAPIPLMFAFAYRQTQLTKSAQRKRIIDHRK